MEKSVLYRNSYSFDEEILKDLIKIKAPANKFDTEVRKILKRKSSKKIYISKKETKIWHNCQWKKVNYRCIPETHAAKNVFCLVLDRSNENEITVIDGYLEAV